MSTEEKKKKRADDDVKLFRCFTFFVTTPLSCLFSFECLLECLVVKKKKKCSSPRVKSISSRSRWGKRDFPTRPIFPFDSLSDVSGWGD